MSFFSVPSHAYDRFMGREGFRAGTPNDQWLAPIFVDAPLLPGYKLVKAFSLRFRLFDGDVLLAIADTPRIVS